MADTMGRSARTRWPLGAAASAGVVAFAIALLTLGSGQAGATAECGTTPGSYPAGAALVSSMSELQTDIADGTSSTGVYYLTSQIIAGHDQNLVLPADSNVTLDLAGCNLSIVQAADGDAAIEVPSSADLTIEDTQNQYENSGAMLTAYGGTGDANIGGGAGIGGNGGQGASAGETSGSVTVDSGQITAYGGGSGNSSGAGAGVGGGGGGETAGPGGSGGPVTTTGGSISAETGGGNGPNMAGVGADIGGGGGGVSNAGVGGSGGAAGTILMEGGEIEVDYSNTGDAPGIGGGNGGLGVNNGPAGSNGSIEVINALAQSSLEGELKAQLTVDTGATLTVPSGGILQPDGGATIQGRLNADNGGQLNIDSGSTVTFTGTSAQGDADGTVASGGDLVLQNGGNFGFSGTVNGGLSVADGSQLSSSSLILNGGGTIAGGLDDPGTLEIGNDSTETFDGANTGSGGPLTVDAGATLGVGANSDFTIGDGATINGSIAVPAGSQIEAAGFNASPVTINNSQTISGSIKVGEGGTLSIPVGVAINEGQNGLNDGEIDLAGALGGAGGLDNEGSIQVSGSNWSLSGYGPRQDQSAPTNVTGRAYEFNFNTPSGGEAADEMWVFASAFEYSGESLPGIDHLDGYTSNGWELSGAPFTDDTQISDYSNPADGPHSFTLTANYTPVSPVISYALSSTGPESAAGWWPGPVTVTFTCNEPTGVTLTEPCPGPQTLSRNGAGQTPASQTVTATNGATATATPPPVSIDQTAPTITWSGPLAGVRYLAGAPAPGCTAAATLSGAATCTVSSTKHQTSVGFRETATADAKSATGVDSTSSRTFVVQTTGLSGAKPAPGTMYLTQSGRTYRLFVLAASRPSVLAAVAKPRTPRGAGKAFTADGTVSGVKRWTTKVKLKAKPATWNVGIRHAGKLTVISL
jgi:hypothetical protein